MKPGDLRTTKLWNDDSGEYRNPAMRRENGRGLRSSAGTYHDRDGATLMVLLHTSTSVQNYRGIRFWCVLSRYGIVYVQEANLEALTEKVT